MKRNKQISILRTVLSATALFIVCELLVAQAEPTWQDINYVGDTLTGHSLDIYLPQEGDGPFPVVISIAGSAWFRNNNKRGAYRIAKSLHENGFAIVATNHRSSRNAIFPAQIHDIKAVARFIRGSAEKYQFDPRFVAITGSSSGGHLAALMGTSGGVDSFTVGTTILSLEGNLGEFTNESSHVDAVVDWYGPTDFQVMDSCGSRLEHDAIDSPESVLVGGLIQENDDMCVLANPITYVDHGDPPFLILHGDQDFVVPHCQSKMLQEVLQSKSVHSNLITVQGAAHGRGMWLAEYTDQMVIFMIAESRKVRQ